MKRICIWILTVSLLIVACATVCAAENESIPRVYKEGQFTDVKETDWFASGVKSAYELGLMNGNGNHTFKPAGNLTVGEALAIACRLHSLHAANGARFEQGNPWYQVYVDYAVANKIMSEGQLNPVKQATREQFAYLMCGAIPSAELEAINTIPSIPDVAEQSTYGGFVYRLYRAGVLTGSDRFGTFRPTTAIQRSEVATVVTRLADKSQRRSVTLAVRPAVTGIQLAGMSKIHVGESVIWTANTLPADSASEITWTAGNPGVATVDANGRVTGKRAGQCHITATAKNGVKKTALLTVSEIAVSGITLSGRTQILAGESTTWTANVLPADATNKRVSWSAGNPGVATVDQTGKITGIKPGECNITVTAANGVKKTVMLYVTNLAREAYKQIILDCLYSCEIVNGAYLRSDFFVESTEISPDGLYYLFYDVNHDGVEELIFVNDSGEESGATLIKMYTYNGKEAVEVDNWWSRSVGSVYTNGVISTFGAGGAMLHGGEFYQFDPKTGKHNVIYTYTVDAWELSETQVAAEWKKIEADIEKLNIGDPVKFTKADGYRVLP